jgi:predicted ABC-type ATPase
MIKTIDKKKCKYKITSNTVNEYINNTILTLKSKDNPICVINVGGPGSGKTTVSKIYIKNILKKNIKDFCIVNPDDILYKYYNNDIHCYEIDNNSPYKVVNDLFEIAVKNNYNILYDTTGLNIKDIKSKISLLKRQNYKINVCVCLVNDMSIIFKRLENRRKLTGRNVDEDYLLKRYKDLPKILNNFYFNLLYKTVHEIIIYNTSGLKPKIQKRYN